MTIPSGKPPVSLAVAGAWFSPRAVTQVSQAAGLLRYQPMDSCGKFVAEVVSEAMSEAGILGGRTIPARAVYGLRHEFSADQEDFDPERGRATQRKHVDYSPTSWRGLPDSDVPLSAVWAALHSFALCDKDGREVTVEAGDIAVFRPDWEHSSGPMVSSAMRAHAFVTAFSRTFSLKSAAAVVATAFLFFAARPASCTLPFTSAFASARLPRPSMSRM